MSFSEERHNMKPMAVNAIQQKGGEALSRGSPVFL